MEGSLGGAPAQLASPLVFSGWRQQATVHCWVTDCTTYCVITSSLKSVKMSLESKSSDGKWWGWRGGATPVAPELLDKHSCSDKDSVLRMPEIEKVHVQRLYDTVASQWHGTRHPAWPRVRSFVEVND
jgi:hypothetical protein